MNHLTLGTRALGAVLLAATSLSAQTQSHYQANLTGFPEQGVSPSPQRLFKRIATFPVFQNTDVNDETVAEIVTSANSGNLLVYTDSATEKIGFVDITDPANPVADGTVDLSGEPTSVGVLGRFALACVNTSADFVNTSGELAVIDLDSRTIVRTIALGGQPDAIAISPNGRYAAIAIENERDEDLGSGEPPQAPAGFVVIVDLVGGVQNWSTRTVDLVGVPDLFPNDPEPEFVDINALNVAVVTLQENNHIVLISLPTGDIIADFPAGTVDLSNVDINENDLIEQDSSLLSVPREPDAVAWTSPFTFATADEGDLFGGSRGFTTYYLDGTTLFEADNTIEHLAARIGHYPEGRSENKGTEPESVEFGRYPGQNYLFVGSERSNFVAVYQQSPLAFIGNSFPRLIQVLPTGVAPEGLHAIPERNLFVVACEEDSRDDKIRASIMIYARSSEPSYPTVYSNNREGLTTPIPWGALSGLTGELDDDETLFSVHDSFYKQSRIFTIDRSQAPARIAEECLVVDSEGVLLAALNDLKAQLPGTPDFDPSDIVNADGTVNLDLEGITRGLDGESFWLASEGAGNLVNGVSDPDDRPFESPNMLIRFVKSPPLPPFVDEFIAITQVVFPPLELTQNQLRFGFEGVASTPFLSSMDEEGDLYVCFQRAWQAAGDDAANARIGHYNFFTQTWSFANYPLDTPSSPNGGWVGLSELTYLGDDSFAVIERDNQGGPDASIKRIYEFSIDGVTFLDNAAAPNFPVLSKSLALDLLAADTFAPTGGPIPEKLEGMSVLSNGTALVVNDNDGVDDNNGETLLIELEELFE